jgi:sugar phosphate permease
MHLESRRDPLLSVPGRGLVLWGLWLTYGSLYFCRNNLGAALPGLGAELGYTKTQLGTVLMALKLTYGAGQFINGQLAERFSPRKLLALGLLASAALNVLFGWATALYLLTFIWACNGYVQALGWAPTMRVAANWFPALQRGRAIGIIGTGYQLCGALTFVVAGWAADKFGWRGALYIPAALLAASAVHMWFVLEEKPPETALPGGERQDGGAGASAALMEPRARRPDRRRDARATNGSLASNIVFTLSNPALWVVGIALCLLDACRYGFTDWGVTHLKEVQATSVSSAAFKYAVFPCGGILGAFFSGWVTDRFFYGRRVPVVCMLLAALGLLTTAYSTVIGWGLPASVTILFLIGFCIFGPQVQLVGTLPVGLAQRGTSAAAAGFVNGMGGLGAAAGDKLTGHLAQNYGWRFAIWFWAGCAFGAALVIATLWKTAQESNEPESLAAEAPLSAHAAGVPPAALK